MSRDKVTPPIVAELGRPESPEETAARKARDSRNYRSRKTVNNLVLSLLVSLAAVLVIVLLVPRSETPIPQAVDYHAIAVQLQQDLERPLADPSLPAGWSANAAEWRPGASDQVPSWYIGLITPANQFIGLTQAFGANPTWLAEQLQHQATSTTISVDDVTWDVYSNTAPEKERGNFDYALTTVSGESTVVLSGTADPSEFRDLASALTADIR